MAKARRRAVGTVDGQAISEHRDKRIGPAKTIAIGFAGWNGVAFADQGSQPLLHRGGAAQTLARGLPKAHRRLEGARLGRSIELGKTPGRVPEQVWVLRKIPERA